MTREPSEDQVSRFGDRLLEIMSGTYSGVEECGNIFYRAEVNFQVNWVGLIYVYYLLELYLSLPANGLRVDLMLIYIYNCGCIPSPLLLSPGIKKRSIPLFILFCQKLHTLMEQLLIVAFSSYPSSLNARLERVAKFLVKVQTRLAHTTVLCTLVWEEVPLKWEGGGLSAK